MVVTMTDFGAIRDAVAEVTDPEIPVLSIVDLGVLRDVRIDVDGRVLITITPTYSGCPAMDTIRRDIKDACARRGWHQVEVRTVLWPAWTTDWMTDEGKRKLREYGIAPPGHACNACLEPFDYFKAI
jgi:ring-1,2-phenylacetyl-CoA epoxidase subunit PaaD